MQPDPALQPSHDMRTGRGAPPEGKISRTNPFRNLHSKVHRLNPLLNQVAIVLPNFLSILLLKKFGHPGEAGHLALLTSFAWLVFGIANAFSLEHSIIRVSSMSPVQRVQEVTRQYRTLALLLGVLCILKVLCFQTLFPDIPLGVLALDAVSSFFYLSFCFWSRLTLMLPQVQRFLTQTLMLSIVGFVAVGAALVFWNAISIEHLLVLSAGVYFFSCWRIVRLWSIDAASLMHAPVEYRENLQYFKKVYWGSLLSWIPTNIYYYFLAFFGDTLTDIENLRVILIFQQPLIHIITSYNVVGIQRLSAATDRPVAARKMISRWLLGVLGAVVAVNLCSVWILDLFDIQSLTNRVVFSIVSLLPIFTCIITVAGALFKLEGRGEVTSHTGTFSALFDLTVGVFLVWKFSMLGAAVAMVSSLCINAMLLLRYSLFLGKVK